MERCSVYAWCSLVTSAKRECQEFYWNGIPHCGTREPVRPSRLGACDGSSVVRRGAIDHPNFPDFLEIWAGHRGNLPKSIAGKT